ncbi:uncharacterized protein LOC131246956 [Magnolia sinica]|uniref:uncharacterized protein LOC131246956 n=1 Tax=Magnolia sinica TaxID=86752 RepID=UPI0026581DEC|nr:uncharacterized protein LOC131246956 [Magnolia sinica]
MEVYIDNMLVKSIKATDHATDLEKIFLILRRYKIKLNPSKCAFGVCSGKFLGFLISQRGIEANSEKIKPLLNMESPKTIKDVQRLTERIKEYLRSPPLLSKPEPGEPLLIYLAVFDAAISLALIRKHEGKQLPVYYISKALVSTEMRYRTLKKVALTLRPESSGRLTKWAVELSEFDIHYKPQTVIKGQALADFIVEVTVQPTIPIADLAESSDRFPPNPPFWSIYIDGSSNSKASGARVVLETLDHTVIQYALRLGFQASNNIAEYKALLLGLQLAASLGVTHLNMYSDSQLVVNQIAGIYQVRKERLKAYLAKARKMITGFHQCSATWIPRAENVKADLPTKLALADEDDIPRSIPIEFVAEPSIGGTESSTLLPIDSEPS